MYEEVYSICFGTKGVFTDQVTRDKSRAQEACDRANKKWRTRLISLFSGGGRWHVHTFKVIDDKPCCNKCITNPQITERQ